MKNSLQGYELPTTDNPSAQARARRVVAAQAHDAEDAREILDALGLISTPVDKPVDTAKTA